MISVLILTRNEEADLPACLASVAGINGDQPDDIHVLDSLSTDRTPAIAKAFGAHLTQRAFDNYAAQRNFGLALPFNYPWLLILDADERVPPALAAELRRIPPSAPSGVAAYRIRRRDFLFDTWLRHTQLSPFYIRLIRPGSARYTRAINEVLEIDGDAPERIQDLTAPLDHFPFSKGIAWWVERHNRYSTLEAELIHHQQGLRNPSLRIALLDPDFHTRRLHQKALFYRLPARPLIKFCVLYFLKRGFLDGRAGFTYAALASIYEYLITLKTAELSAPKEGSLAVTNDPVSAREAPGGDLAP